MRTLKLLDTCLLYFYEVAQCGSVRKAAEKLHVSPSAISRMIAKAERHFETELFERHTGGMDLTATGKALAEELNDVVSDLNRAETKIDELKGLVRGEVTLYCIEALVSGLVPSFLTKFNQRYPGVRFIVNVMGTEKIIDGILTDSADIGITFNATHRPEVEVLMKIHQSLHVLVSPRHHLASRSSMSLLEIFQYPLAMFDSSFGGRRIIDQAARTLCIEECSLLLTGNSLATTYGMAYAGSCITLSYPLAAKFAMDSGLLVAIPIDEQELLIGAVAVCKRQGRRLSTAANALLVQIEEDFHLYLNQ